MLGVAASGALTWREPKTAAKSAHCILAAVGPERPLGT